VICHFLVRPSPWFVPSARLGVTAFAWFKEAWSRCAAGATAALGLGRQGQAFDRGGRTHHACLEAEVCSSVRPAAPTPRAAKAQRRLHLSISGPVSRAFKLRWGDFAKASAGPAPGIRATSSVTSQRGDSRYSIPSTGQYFASVHLQYFMRRVRCLLETMPQRDFSCVRHACLMRRI
jgi:hypothetical protein